MKSLLPISLILTIFCVSCFSCAPNYDSAQWAKNVKPQKKNYDCIKAKKPRKKKGYK